MVELTIAEACKVYGGSHIDDKIMLIDNLSLVPLPLVPRRTNCVILGLCLKGKAQYTVDTKKYEVRPGDAIIVNDGQVMDNYMVSPDLAGVGYFVSVDFFNEVVKGVRDLSAIYLFSRTHPVFHLTEKESEAFQTYFHLIQEKVEQESHHFRTDVVRSLFTTLIYDLSESIYRLQQEQNIDVPHGTRAEILFTNFLTLVEKHFREERRVSWYAEQLGISPKYLSEMVKQASRRTPNEWIDNYVVLELRLLLKNSSLTVKEISKKMKFPNQSFLGKYFKEHVGVSPRRYRIGQDGSKK